MKERKRTCLRAGHQIAANAADGETVFLHRGGTSVVAANDIIEKRFGNVFFRKLGNGLGDVVTVHFDWNVVVLPVRVRHSTRTLSKFIPSVTCSIDSNNSFSENLEGRKEPWKPR